MSKDPKARLGSNSPTGPIPQIPATATPLALVMTLFGSKLWSDQRQTGGAGDGVRRVTSRHGGDHAGPGERGGLHRHSGVKAGKEDGQPGRRLGLPPVLRRRVGAAGDGGNLLRLAPPEGRPEPRWRGGDLGD